MHGKIDFRSDEMFTESVQDEDEDEKNEYKHREDASNSLLGEMSPSFTHYVSTHKKVIKQLLVGVSFVAWSHFGNDCLQIICPFFDIRSKTAYKNFFKNFIRFVVSYF